jgi:hypothetical protein
MRPMSQPVFGRRASRKSLLVRIVEALQVSRRIEARRLLRQRHHLIAEDFQELARRTSTDFNQANESTANANGNESFVPANNRALQSV